MDIPGTAALREARLHLSTEGGRHVFLLDPPGGRQLLRLTGRAARVLHDARAALGRRGGDAGAVAAAAQYLNGLRRGALGARTTFNPLMTTVPLFDVRPWQPALAGLARRLFSRAGALGFALAVLAAFWLAAGTGFAFFAQIGDVLSPEALLTFALIAPVLKVFHELGHVLAATRFGVPVRRAGIMLIALFPMPWVDCTEADFRASRRGRIVISLAGLLSDMAVALTAFLAWHLVEGAYLRQFLANVFVFGTATTLIFNLNPLMKLDGYFALADAMNRRNWYTDSARALKAVTGDLLELRLRAALAGLRAHGGRVAYAIASFGYRIWIVAVIALALLPKYLGLGALLVAWGAAVMFLTPMFRSGGAAKEGSRRRWVGRTVFAGLLAALAFVPLPYTHTGEIALDVEGTYAVRAGTDGGVIDLASPGEVAEGAVLARLANVETEVRLALNAADRKMFAFLVESMGARDPVAAQAGAERLAAAEALERTLAAEAGRREIVAPGPGRFHPRADLRTGSHVALGDPVGTFLPEAAVATAIGSLPEIYAEKFATALTGAEVRRPSGFLARADGVAVTLRQAEAPGPGGERRLRLAVEIPAPPGDLVRERLHLRLTFADEPLWRHAVFLYRRLRLNVLQTRQLADQGR